MANYRCMNCNYRFVPKSNRAPTRCPYCSTEGKLVTEKSADQIVREV
ncbi:hypothetical protein HOK51_08785 [Candidatus Woesearchaeota archaeon]|jgi:DNA-directed RNA polymerase subunit RPC12/RpoP|nr:hypothetical protein [Candidatus Woesearchaeota archaeon]MBT6519923.1 hypothetical protein [Candidatus Woesearchaeota archaeon]MBT7367101.1 hypothetical protein [Candidatus Woesearchaeota archaeon]